jgi:hypothetical protein
MDSNLLAEVRAWIQDDPDPKTAAQLNALLEAADEKTLRQYFAGFLEFGTAGLRGPLGPGPSCMNQAVVGKTAAGIVKYMKERSLTSVVIGAMLGMDQKFLNTSVLRFLVVLALAFQYYLVPCQHLYLPLQ